MPSDALGTSRNHIFGPIFLQCMHAAASLGNRLSVPRIVPVASNTCHPRRSKATQEITCTSLAVENSMPTNNLVDLCEN